MKENYVSLLERWKWDVESYESDVKDEEMFEDGIDNEMFEDWIDNEMFELEQKYSSKFGHGVPREMLPPIVSENQIKEAVKKCIEDNQDNLFELLGVSVDNDKYLY